MFVGACRAWNVVTFMANSFPVFFSRTRYTFPTSPSSQHFDLGEAPGTYLHLHKQTNRCIEAITRIRRNRRNADVPT